MAVNPTLLNALLLGMVALTNAIAAYITNSLAAKRSDRVANQLATTTNSQNNKLETVANKLQTVATRQDNKLDALASVADKTHQLVNSKMGEVLTALVVSAQALYNLDSSEANLNLLNVAKRNLEEHTARQLNADSLAKEK
jgi:hypothetical protein